MSDPSPAIEDEDERVDDDGTDLQFDQAEPLTPTSSGPSCAGCKRPIADAYYEINGKVICHSCRQQVEASFRGGSGLARFLKASLFGLASAVFGAALYFIVCRVTGLNIGLVAIVVGLMVGGAVRKGTGNRGGVLYQILAVFLAYFAIGLMRVPFEVEGLFNQPAQKNEHGKAIPGDGPKELAKVNNEPNAPKLATEGPDQADVKAVAPPQPPPEKVGLVRFSLVLMFISLVIIAVAPVMNAIHNPISGLIYCFALWEAWKLNQGAKLVFSGPFRVSEGTSSHSGPGVALDGG